MINRSPNLAQKTRPYSNQQQKREFVKLWLCCTGWPHNKTERNWNIYIGISSVTWNLGYHKSYSFVLSWTLEKSNCFIGKFLEVEKYRFNSKNSMEFIDKNLQLQSWKNLFLPYNKASLYLLVTISIKLLFTFTTRQGNFKKTNLFLPYNFILIVTRRYRLEIKQAYTF